MQQGLFWSGEAADPQGPRVPSVGNYKEQQPAPRRDAPLFLAHRDTFFRYASRGGMR